MSAKRKASVSPELSEILHDFLELAALPVGASGLLNALGQLRGELEGLGHLDAGDLQEMLEGLQADGRLLRGEDGLWSLAAPSEGEAVRQILARPGWDQAAAVISRAFPVLGADGQGDPARLQRDLRNAFFGKNTSLLNTALSVLRDVFPSDYYSGAALRFLLDEPMEWLVSLPEAFLSVLAWQLVPLAVREFRPIRPLLERLYALSATAKPQVICPLVDCAIMSGEWKRVATLVRRLPVGLTARISRVAWLRYITGKDEDAVSYYLDALDGLRRDRHAHDVFFITVGGIFMIMAELRCNTETALASAENHVQYAIQDRNEFRQVYMLLDQVIRDRRIPELPSSRIIWSASSHLNDALCCIAQYWLDGTLQPAQRLLLDAAATAARAGGYLWIPEECEELCRRLDDPTGRTVRHWHDERNQIPYMLDTIVQHSSWGERMIRLEHVLGARPDQTRRRLAWFVDLSEANTGLYRVKPIEQHSSSRNGRWLRGRKFAAYRRLNYSAIEAAAPREGTAAPMLSDELELTAQDKFACDTLRNAEEFLAAQRERVKEDPALQRRVWAQVVQSLVGCDRLFLEDGDGHQITCLNAVPSIRIAPSGADGIGYHVEPSPREGDDSFVRLENGDQLCLYRYDEELLKLMDVLGSEFVIQADSIKENTEIISLLLRRHRLVSECRLDWLEVTPEHCDDTPVVRLAPEGKGLRVEIGVCPFGNDRECFCPGTGPLEVLYRDGERTVRRARDFAAELSRAQALVVSCPKLASMEDSDGAWRWHLEGEACYELSLQLQRMGGICRVLWPVDKKVVCNHTLTLGNVSIHTESYQNWFSVDGEVRLEGSDATATLAELLQAAVNERKNFIQLSDGQMVALSEELRRHLEALARMGEIKAREGNVGGSLKVCRFLMPFMSEILHGFSGETISAQCQGWLDAYNGAMKQTPKVPGELNAKLRQYQQEGFVWLSRLDAAHAGACLADDMGLGKTLQAITLMLAKAAEGPSLVVAPTSVCSNWLNEINRFAPSLNCEVFGGGKRSESFKRLGPGHVLVVSYGLLQSEQREFRKVKWRIAVLDEAQAIKNSHAKRSQAARGIDADFRIVTTGTPVENNLAELWSIFDFIIPGLLGSYENFRRRFEVLIDNDNNQEASRHLKSIVSPFLLRRCKDQVLNELPPKSDIDYPIEMSSQEAEFYDKLRRRILADLETHQENDGQKHIRVLTGITKLRLAVDHPSLVEGGDGIPGAKLEAFLELLKGVLENGHKVLVFSQFVRFLGVVREALNANHIDYLYLDGAMSARERKTAVDGFQSGVVPVFLISLKAGGLGLNLTQADYVIHLDSWWNPAVENQASDRAYRLGQDKPVTIYHLQTRNTIEDRIKMLHQRKRDLADKLLSDSDTIETVPLEELLKLLRD